MTDISGLNKVELLHALWLGQKPAGFFQGRPGPVWSADDAEEAVKNYIDYYCGRAIKLDLSGDTVDPWLYDRDANIKFNQIVENLRKQS